MTDFEIGDWPNRILFGVDSVGQLQLEATRLKVARVLIICGASVARGEMLTRVRSGLGAACVGLFADVQAQNPLPCIQKGAELALSLRADALLSVGGGSAIDAAKCIAMFLASDGNLEPYQLQHAGTVPAMNLSSAEVLPHLAVPTTAGSASEVMPTAGCRDPKARRKLLFWDTALVPKVVILDPKMAVFSPPSLTAHSGMTAVARCIESLYSAHRQPISSALALRAVRMLVRSLERCIAEPMNLEARADCQIASLMSGIAAINAMVSMVHAICHTLGGRFGMQHGAGHAMLLAPAMRVLLPSLGSDQLELLAAIGGETRNDAPVDSAGLSAAQIIADLAAALPLPRRLRDCGINQHQDLEDISIAAMSDYMMASAPRPISRAEIVSLLSSVW
ncbi:MAG TPA: iron-containing alcohol dehydrogenase [Steroidobacteraceae bacterium]